MLINIFDNDVMNELPDFDEAFDAYLQRRGINAKEDAKIRAEVDSVMRKDALSIMVRNAREALGLTQQQLAQLSKVPQGEISKIERSKGNPTFETIGKIATALHLEVALVPVGIAQTFVAMPQVS